MSKPTRRYSTQRPKKSLAQHFLTDMKVVNKIISVTDLTPDDVVVELGAGKGVLTRFLLTKAKQVVAVELDRRWCEKLRHSFDHFESFHLLEDDILRVSFARICDDLGLSQVKVVGNLPYNITSPIVFKLLEERAYITDAILMMQLEVAERLAAQPGTKAYGVPTVLTQIHANPEILFMVPPRAFRPAPKVQSAVIRLSWHEEPPVEIEDESFFVRVVKVAFSQRRKMLRNTLKSLPNVTRDSLERVESIAGIDLTRRAETLSLDEFALLASTIQDLQ